MAVSGMTDALSDRFVGPGSDAAGYRAAVVRLPAGQLRRVAAWALMPLRLALEERRLARAGARIVGRFACYPDADRPTFVYELSSAAARYTETQLIAAVPRGRLDALVRRVLTRWNRCHCSVGGIVIVGVPQPGVVSRAPRG